MIKRLISCVAALLLGLPVANAVTLFGLNADGTPLINPDQLGECPGEAGDGALERSYANGKRWYKGTCTGGLMTGKWTFYHQNGEVEFKLTMAAGRISGKFSSYYEDGQLRAKGVYSDTNREGKFILYHQNGEKRAQGKYTANLNKGCWKEYHDNGQMRAKGAYAEDRRRPQPGQVLLAHLLARVPLFSVVPVHARHWNPVSYSMSSESWTPASSAGETEDLHPMSVIPVQANLRARHWNPGS